MKRKSPPAQHSTTEKLQSTANRRRINGRACIHCHQLKIRCDMLEIGAPCTSCSSRNRPGCRIYQNKKLIRIEPRDPVPILPRRSSRAPTPEPATESAQTLRLPRKDTGNIEDIEEYDHDHLADFFNQQEVREADFGYLTRMCFIGTGMSNCHYLVRQSPLQASHESIFHFGYRQSRPQDGCYYVHRVPSEMLERPSKRVADMLIRAYFERVNRGWPIVDEEWFMAQYEEKDPENLVSLALLNAIFLVGSHVLASQDESLQSLQPVFFHRAKTLVDCRFEQDRLVHVQVALLMTWHSAGLEEIVASAWHWIGVATRTALVVGMHRDATRSKMLPVHRRAYTRLWWILVQFDTISSVSSGRPQAINLEDSDVPDLDHSHFEGIPEAEEDFTIYHTKLCIIISRTMREGWALRSSPEDRVRATRKAGIYLAELSLQLPESIQLKVSSVNIWQATLHLTYNNFVILLHRPPPKHTVTGDQVAKQCSHPILCADAVGAISSIFETLVSKNTLSSLWLYSNNVLVTAMIHIIHEAASDDPLVAAKSQRILDTLIRSLQGMSKHWQYANPWLKFFEQKASMLKQKRVLSAQEGSATYQYLDDDEQRDLTAWTVHGMQRISQNIEKTQFCDQAEIQYQTGSEKSFPDGDENRATATFDSAMEENIIDEGTDFNFPDILFPFDPLAFDPFQSAYHGDL